MRLHGTEKEVLMRARARGSGAVKLLLGAVFVAFSFAGCGLSSATITIHYTPQRQPADVPGAGAVQVQVEVEDQRPVKDRVGTKILESVPILAANDVVELLRKSIEQELANRGYRIGAGQVVVKVELEKFWNTFANMFAFFRCVGEVIFAVRVKDPAGNVLFAERVVGAFEHSAQVVSGGNAQESVEGALREAIRKLMGNDAFPAALGKAATASSSGGEKRD
ncbi:MAG: YajG family lipoprotein [Thermoanaerobaculia bacterium]